MVEPAKRSRLRVWLAATVLAHLIAAGAWAGLTSEVAYLFLNGEGYDIQWSWATMPGPGVPFERLDYKAGTLLTPGSGYHQHFNATTDPIRYVVLRFGSPELLGQGSTRGVTKPPQIEFDEEDPAVWETFVEELASRGLEPKMQEYKGK